MKKFSFGLVLFSVALCVLLLICPMKGYADIMTVTLEGVGGQSSGTNPDVYVYPYYFSFDGSSALTPLMCISYENEIYFGETWTANMVPVKGNELYVEAAYILALAAAPDVSADTTAVAQWANWELFDPSDSNLLANLPAGYQPQIDTMLATAANFAKDNVNTTDFPNIDVFIPEAGTQPAGDGYPQTFVGDPAGGPIYPPDLAPEPSSYLLFGTGLLSLAALWFRRRCIA